MSRNPAAVCTNCRYSHETNVNDPLECRFAPPQVIPVHTESFDSKTVWPCVSRDDWCGVFNHKRAK